MSRQWKELVLFLVHLTEVNFINQTLCRCHKNTIPKTKTSGCTMIYSFYIKNRNTVKVLFGCSTGGLVSYLSPAYGGSDVTLTFLKK